MISSKEIYDEPTLVSIEPYLCRFAKKEFVSKFGNLQKINNITSYQVDKFCQSIGISYNDIKNPNNTLLPTVDQFAKLANYFDVSPDDLLSKKYWGNLTGSFKEPWTSSKITNFQTAITNSGYSIEKLAELIGKEKNYFNQNNAYKQLTDIQYAIICKAINADPKKISFGVIQPVSPSSEKSSNKKIAQPNTKIFPPVVKTETMAAEANVSGVIEQEKETSVIPEDKKNTTTIVDNIIINSIPTMTSTDQITAIIATRNPDGTITSVLCADRETAEKQLASEMKQRMLHQFKTTGKADGRDLNIINVPFDLTTSPGASLLCLIPVVPAPDRLVFDKNA